MITLPRPRHLNGFLLPARPAREVGKRSIGSGQAACRKATASEASPSLAITNHHRPLPCDFARPNYPPANSSLALAVNSSAPLLYILRHLHRRPLSLRRHCSLPIVQPLSPRNRCLGCDDIDPLSREATESQPYLRQPRPDHHQRSGRSSTIISLLLVPSIYSSAA